MILPIAQLPEIYQGILYIVVGGIALLYALGIIEKGITILIVGLSLYAIVIGCIKIGIYQKVTIVEKKQ